MATERFFNGATRIEPDIYTQFLSEETAALPTVSTGTTLIIDTGIGTGFGFGAGFNGETSQGRKNIVTGNTLQQFRAKVNGGVFYDLSRALFKPLDDTTLGVEKLLYMRAADTYAGKIGLQFSGVSNGTGAVLTPTLKVNQAFVIGGGTGYAVSDTITLAGGTFATAAVLTVTSIGVGGIITGVNITTVGVYSAIPSDYNNIIQSATSGVGTGATFRAFFNLGSIIITTAGTGYAVAPTLTIVGGGTTATATATVASGLITATTIVDNGTRFFDLPRILVTPNGSNNGGTIIVRTKTEGTVANGKNLSSLLTKGFSATIVAGIADNTKFIIKFWRGTFSGLDEYGVPYNGLIEANTTPILLAQSTEINSISQFLAWAANDANFNASFEVKSTLIVGTGTFTTSNTIALNSGNILAVGGGEYYNQQALSDFLNTIGDLNFQFVLCTDFGATATGAQNTNNFLIKALLDSPTTNHIATMFVGVGKNDSELKSTYGSLPTAALFDGEKAVVVHSDVYENLPSRVNVRRSVLYTAAYILGRTAGILPQDPTTQKAINVAGVESLLPLNLREEALQGGVLHLKEVNGTYVVNQSINTLQGEKNKQLLNQDGTSYEISIVRCKAFLQDSFTLEGRAAGLGGGQNRTTITNNDALGFTIDFLERQIGQSIVSFKDVTVTRVQDYFDIFATVAINSPINKTFFTVNLTTA